MKNKYYLSNVNTMSAHTIITWGPESVDIVRVVKFVKKSLNNLIDRIKFKKVQLN